MQFLTAKSLLYCRVVFLSLITFLCVKDPVMITESNFAVLFGQAMQLPMVQLKTFNPLLGILAVVFGVLAVSDLIPLIANNIEYFESIVPTRLIIYFALAGFSYFTSSELFGNNLIFVYSFFEVWFNFLIFNNLRDEKYYRIKKFIEENGDILKDDDKVRVVEIE